MIDWAIANAHLLHMADNCLEGFDIIAWVAVKLNIGNVSSITEFVVRSLLVNLVEGTDVVIDRYMEWISVELAVRHSLDSAIVFTIHLNKTTRQAFCRSSNDAVV